LKLVYLLDSAQSHKQRGHHASAISGSGFTLAKQKVTKQQLITVSLLSLNI